MSGYLYGQFNEDPNVYASHSASPQQQQPSQLQQLQQQQQHQHQPQQQHQEPPGAYPQWETLEQLERHAQDIEVPMHSPLELDLTPLHTPNSASFHSRPLEIDLNDPPHMVPSQSSPVNNSPILLHDPHMFQQHQQALAQHQVQQFQHQHQQMLMSRPGSSTGPLLFSNAPQPPTLGPSAGANPPGTAGVVRSASTRGGRIAHANPYSRLSPAPPGGVAAFLLGTSSAASSPAASGSSGASAGKVGSTSVAPPRSRKPSVRFSRPEPIAVAVPTTLAPRPKTGRAQTRTKPSIAMPPSSVRLPFTGSSTDSPQPRPSFSAQGTTHSPQTQSPLSRTPLASSSALPLAQSSPYVLQERSPLSNPPSHSTSRPSRSLPSQKLPMRSIPADMAYSDETHTLSASLEVPGVSRENVRVTMGTCYFNRIKFVCVVAQSAPAFPWAVGYGQEAMPRGKGKGPVQPVREEEEEEEGEESEGGGDGVDEDRPKGQPTTKAPSPTHATSQGTPPPLPPTSSTFTPTLPGLGKVYNPNFRERKFGLARRLIQVPATTTPEDIYASLKDGVLTLTIHLGEPFEEDDEMEIPVR